MCMPPSQIEVGATETARALGVSVGSVNLWCRQGRLAYRTCRVTGRRRFSVETIEQAQREGLRERRKAK